MVWIASDHAGFELKKRIAVWLRKNNFEYQDLGTDSEEAVDYPIYAHQVADKVARNNADRGILLCSSGQGMAMAANRHRGVRAAVAWEKEIAMMSRQHNDSNVLVLPADHIEVKDAIETVKEWLSTDFTKEERHARRIQEIEKV